MRMSVGFVVASAVVAAVALKTVPEMATRSLAVATAPEKPPLAAEVVGGRKVAIPADRDGHYVTEAIVEGHTIGVVIDTGATVVALTAETARRLGIRPAASDFNRPVTTANGVVKVAMVTLKEIRVGTISVDNVRAIVVPGNALGTNLLGLSFLNRIRKFEVGGGQLVLSD